MVLDLKTVPQFVIEREIPGAGALSEPQIHELAAALITDVEGNGATDPVAPWLRHRGQGLLHLLRAR
jgi:hypothetical protein